MQGRVGLCYREFGGTHLAPLALSRNSHERLHIALCSGASWAGRRRCCRLRQYVLLLLLSLEKILSIPRPQRSVAAPKDSLDNILKLQKRGAVRFARLLVAARVCNLL